jgi:DNA-binding winged helix-turn-helix (wHTH) protein
MPGAGTNLVFMCKQWEVDIGRREIRSRGTPVALGNRAFEIVEALARAEGQLVSKDDLMERIWPGLIVGDNTLQVHISAVRKALGPDRGMLKTSHGRGYRLVGDWTIGHGRAAEMPPVPPPRFSSSQRPPTNLPVIVAELIGRSTAVQSVRDLLSAYRVVTLSGPGGIGKTVLAVKIARDLLADFGDGAWLVELASLSDPALVPSAAASALDLKLGGERVTAESLAPTWPRR